MRRRGFCALVAGSLLAGCGNRSGEQTASPTATCIQTAVTRPNGADEESGPMRRSYPTPPESLNTETVEPYFTRFERAYALNRAASENSYSEYSVSIRTSDGPTYGDREWVVTLRVIEQFSVQGEPPTAVGTGAYTVRYRLTPQGLYRATVTDETAGEPALVACAPRSSSF